VICANCAATLTGPFCASCGQAARDFHRPLWTLLSEAVGEFFSLDTRLMRTLRPLLLKPGEVTREYLAGRRVTYVPPLRAYLIAALIFFGCFTVFPTEAPPVYVFVSGSADAEALQQSARGSRVTIELPQRIWFADRRFQEVSKRALANPEEFALAAYRNIPRAFFLFVPVFALILELFFRKAYYVDHLVFALYYHVILFLGFTMFFLIARLPWLPDVFVMTVRFGIVLWLLAYIPVAFRRVYGGSKLMTAVKSAAFLFFYVFGFANFGFLFVISMAVLTF
jgi:hypothetical protein